jgi:antitoxin ParD1/3/4
MRTNIDIDDQLMDAALRAGPFKTKREAVEAGLALVARQAVYREVLKWRGQLRWDGDDLVDATGPSSAPLAKRTSGKVGNQAMTKGAKAMVAKTKVAKASKAQGRQ